MTRRPKQTAERDYRTWLIHKRRGCNSRSSSQIKGWKQLSWASKGGYNAQQSAPNNQQQAGTMMTGKSKVHGGQK